MKRKEKIVKTLKFNGVVADNDYEEVYDWFGMECITLITEVLLIPLS